MPLFMFLAGLILGGAGVAAYLRYPPPPAAAVETHTHSDAHDHAVPSPLVAQVVTRSIAVHMDDSMRFSPDTVQVHAGEVIRFVLHNGGKLAHEFVLGQPDEIDAHAAQMRQAASAPETAGHHHHGAGAALSVAPGQMGEIVVGFSGPGTLVMACLVPGHYEAGMKGTVEVLAADASEAPHSHDDMPEGMDHHH